MNQATTDQDLRSGRDDVDLYREACQRAEGIYSALGFALVSNGIFVHERLGFDLLPFTEREDYETPTDYAIRSAYEAGIAHGRAEKA